MINDIKQEAEKFVPVGPMRVFLTMYKLIIMETLRH